MFEKRNQFCCTGFLRSSKLVHLDGKTLVSFFQNLVQILTNLVLRSKSDKNQPENGLN